jgi:hypothetical protein
MFQDQVPEAVWDLRESPQLSTSSRLYFIFLLIVCIVVSVEVFRAWRNALPFRQPRHPNNPFYLTMLETSRNKLKQWIVCTLLASGILTSLDLYDFCNRSLIENTSGRFAVLLTVREYATELTMGLLVVLFAFLVQWHFLARIQQLRQGSNGKLTPE